MLRAPLVRLLLAAARFPSCNGTHDDCEITPTAVHNFFGNIGMRSATRRCLKNDGRIGESIELLRKIGYPGDI